MGNSLHPAAVTVICVVGAPLAVYSLFIALASWPVVQRHFLYSHKIHNAWWTNLNDPEKWGFARNQVTPFGLVTADGETLYAWHIMPLPLYLKNEAKVATQDLGYSKEFMSTDSFRLLREDPEARLILYFHGNAGHTAQGVRPDSYHSLTDTSSYHVIAIDYRGFGHSTGVPTEEGLIDDASALVEWAMKVAGVSPSRIVLLGHSLGTAVTAGVAERYISHGVEFAGVILISGFSDYAKMLSEYRFGVIPPVLAPLRVWPALHRFVSGRIVDKWQSDVRVASLVKGTTGRLRLSFVHAKNDYNVPCTEDDKLFRAATREVVSDEEFDAWKEERTVHKGKGAFVTTWTGEPDIVVRQELFPHGGHNSFMSYAPVVLAVMRSFDLGGTTYDSRIEDGVQK